MNAPIELSLLGPFQAERAGRRLTAFKSGKVRALLAYLAVEREAPQHRDVLAGMLWPTSTDKRALAMLRDVLSNLRRVLGDRDAAVPVIQVAGDTLQLNPTALRLDVAVFESLTAADASTDNALAEAVALYRGDFLEGFALRHAPDFEAWLLLRRETYRRMMLDALYRLTTAALQRGDYAAAQASARRQLTLDNYREDAHRQLLRALALDGQRNHAVAHYADYRALLAEELNVVPDIRTTALYQRIRDHQLTPAPERGKPPRFVDPADGGSRPAEPPAFVARDAELARLTAGLYRAQQGEGQVLLVAGEAGSGKTMLVETFIRRTVVSAVDTLAAWGACNAQVGEGDPYLPFREILRLLSGDFDVPTLSDCLIPALVQRLEAQAPDFLAALQDVGPDLMGTLVPAGPHIPRSELQAARTPPGTAAVCDQVVRVLRTVARRHTLILVLDDLHWADSGTLNLLTHLSRQLRGSRILCIAGFRPTEAPPAVIDTLHELRRRWGDVTLDLDQTPGRAFVDAVLDRMPNTLGPAFRERLYRQTAGHALFTVALVQQLQTDGELRRDAAGAWGAPEDLDWRRVPPRVEAVIAARVARLPEDLRALLTMASVEGQTFTAEVVARGLEVPTDMVRRALSGPLSSTHPWVAALGVERASARRVARYHFRHILFQQYLYAQLDPVQRAQFHQRVGTALEALHAGEPEVAARLAYHFEAAGLLEKAVTYLTQAGAYAYRLSAPGEAVALYRRGLALLADLPASPARDPLELALQMKLEGPLLVTRGWAAPARVVALERAYGLAQRVQDIPRLLTTLYALADLRIAEGKTRQALAHAEQLVSLAKQVGDRGYEALGYRMTGVSHFFLGHYREARCQLENGLACYAALRRQPDASATEADIGRAVFLWAWLPHVLLGLGYPEQAAARCREALASVQPDGPVHAQAMMLTIAAASFHAMARQPSTALRDAEELLALATEHEMVGFRGWATFFCAWARVALVGDRADLAQLTAGWEDLKATNAQGSLPQLSVLLAEAYAREGEIERSAAILAEAHDLAIRTEAASHLAEIYRLQGELCQATDPARAERLFERAIDVAQAQEARLWALRATVDLARLWQAQGRTEEAAARLGAIYAWFTEGFAAPDLVEARALLDELGAHPPVPPPRGGG